MEAENFYICDRDLFLCIISFVSLDKNVYLFVTQRLKDIISSRINSVSVFFIFFVVIEFKIKDDEEIKFSHFY